MQPCLTGIKNTPPSCVFLAFQQSRRLYLCVLCFWPDDSKFPEAVRVLFTWLERGEVNRRNANNFYSMIQSSNGHIRRLTGEKSQHEKEMEEAKDKFKTALAGIVTQCESYSISRQHHWCLCTVQRFPLEYPQSHLYTVHYESILIIQVNEDEGNQSMFVRGFDFCVGDTEKQPKFTADWMALHVQVVTIEDRLPVKTLVCKHCKYICLRPLMTSRKKSMFTYWRYELYLL